MAIIYILLSAIILLLVITIVFAYRASTPKNDEALVGVKFQLDNIGMNLNKIEASVKEEISTNRTELTKSEKGTRDELSSSLKTFGDLISNSIKATTDLQKTQLETFSSHLAALTKTFEGKLQAFQETIVINSKESRKELKEALDTFKTDLNMSLKDFSERQRENFNNLIQTENTQTAATATKLDAMRDTVEKKIAALQEGNEKKLEEMRKTVDEKLHDTLEKRLGESFKLVSERLEAVHQGLGDMKQLAVGVGDLKRVLTNVKTRGVLGEYQLENILDQLLTNDQYGKNIKTKSASNALVEFAIKLPGREDTGKSVWLPVDSKFPKEDFELLMNAYDNGVPELIDEHRRNFVRGIKKCAGEICERYIDPPNTTDFAILFLPFESLYAEVLRTPGLFESLQKDCKIIITGPATLSALLSSLQMGFRTLAIEKRSSEVWDLLGAVKTEFGNFGNILDRTQKKLTEASNVIEQAGKRSRAIERRLRTVQEIPKEQAIIMLGELPELEEDTTDEIIDSLDS
ncbi:MAG: DNA recombination protein RmuC [Chitinophagales bacterium]|nr:DNA recombination protein RmuC [Chitinophagales bacterium]